MKLILAAGMARTGSTWLYNVLACCHNCAGLTVYRASIEDYQADVEADAHIVKLHNYTEAAECLRTRAALVCTMYRDLRDTAASMVRKGWISGEPHELIPYLRQTLAQQYDAWKPFSGLEVTYEDAMRRPKTTILRLLCALNLLTVNPCEVMADMEKIGRWRSHAVDPETQIWPGHITDGGIGTYGRTLSPAAVEAIENLMAERQ